MRLRIADLALFGVMVACFLAFAMPRVRGALNLFVFWPACAVVGIVVALRRRLPWWLGGIAVLLMGPGGLWFLLAYSVKLDSLPLEPEEDGPVWDGLQGDVDHPFDQPHVPYSFED